MSAIIRATEKSLAARTLTAPVITVYNTQRANLTVVNQLSYIQDFDVEVAQTSFIADPIVDVVKSGFHMKISGGLVAKGVLGVSLDFARSQLETPIKTKKLKALGIGAPMTRQLPKLNEVRLKARAEIQPGQAAIYVRGKQVLVIEAKRVTD